MNVLEQFEQAMDIPKINIEETKVSFSLDDSKLSFENDVLSFENDEMNEDVANAEYKSTNKEEPTTTTKIDVSADIDYYSKEDISEETLMDVSKWLKGIITSNIRNDITNYSKHVLKNLDSYTKETLYSELEKIKNAYNGVAAARRGKLR